MLPNDKEAFHTRIMRAMEGHPRCPVPVHGRLTWFRDLLEKETGEAVSLQTVQKWSTGASVPRAQKITKIAQTLGVDEIWLAMGRVQPQTDKSKMKRARTASGSLLFVAGLAEMSGGHVAFPDQPGEAPNSVFVTMNGTFRQITVVAADVTGQSVRAEVPAASAGIVLGLERREDNPLCVRIFNLSDAPRSPDGNVNAPLKSTVEVKDIAELFPA